MLQPVLPQPAARTPPDVRAGRRIRLVQILLSPIIMLVVVAYELYVVPSFGQEHRLTLHLIFYGLAGPLVTFFTLRWLERGVVAREAAERELRVLYGELRASHRLLDTVQRLIRTLAEAADLDEVLDEAAQGAMEASGATHSSLRLTGGLERRARSKQTLLTAPSADLRELVVPLTVGGAALGELRLYFEQPPQPELIRLAEVLAAEVSTAIEAARNRTRDLMTLYEVDQSIHAERNMRRLLERLTGNIAGRVAAEARAAYLSDQDGVLRLMWSRPLEGEPELTGGVAAFARRTAEAARPLLASPEEAAEVFAGAHSALGLPMMGENELIGVIVLGRREAHAFEDARLSLLALLASQATLAVRNARAYLYSEELAIGEERSRIAREIHDGVAQSLAYCALKLDVAGRQLSIDPPRAAAEIEQAGTILREQIREVRRSIFALRPIDLERYGLLETVRRYVSDFGEQNGLRTHLDIDGEINLSPGDEAVVFRILQESLNNVAKHARARELWVELTGGSSVRLLVRDDGVGFDPAEISGRVSSAGGLGLTQMRERVQSRGGRYSVASAPDQGTRIEATLPQG